MKLKEPSMLSQKMLATDLCILKWERLVSKIILRITSGQLHSLTVNEVCFLVSLLFSVGAYGYQATAVLSRPVTVCVSLWQFLESGA